MPKKITKTADRSPSPAGAGAPAEAFAPAPEDFAVVVAFGYLYSLYGASALAKVQAIASGLNTPAEEGGAEYVLGLEEGLWLSAVLSYGMQLVNYTLSRFAIADNFTGLVEFLPAAVIMYTRLSSPHPRQTLLTYMLGAWSLRLGLFLAYRLVARSGPDSRMDALRNQRGVLKAGLLSFWLIHGTWGFVVSLPVTLGNALGHASAQPLGDLDWLGLAVFAVGFCMEAVADQAKLTSYVNGDKARYYDQGGHPLWRFTRHPNFGGEILCWLGVAIVGSSVSLPPAGSVCACGAEGMLLRWGSLGLTVVLMLGEAGLLAERKNNHRFGSDPAFLRYRQSTSFIVPCPPAIYAAIPSSLKQLLFADLPVYRLGLDDTALRLAAASGASDEPQPEPEPVGVGYTLDDDGPNPPDDDATVPRVGRGAFTFAKGERVQCEECYKTTVCAEACNEGELRCINPYCGEVIRRKKNQ